MAESPAPTIHLNEREERLKNLLVDVADFIDKHPVDTAEDGKTKPEPVVLRWAGGWVRDKLLGIESHDIDTAINCMTGEAFALRLRTFCESEANREKHSIGPEDVSILYKVARNPEKSKHLETTTSRLFGLDIDFVNLRRETYAEDSRNPQMEFGTPEEDAERRDATVNALFYRLDTASIEDFTGGLPDLEAKLMRTPLEPLKTFTDDPLRVLRLIRFASRLGFTIDPAAARVMADETVLRNLKVKISRERVGVELEKMLKGEHSLAIPPVPARCR
jgi:tRNA nucleotidyltransferase (CCA-adding enzyme)